MDCQASPGASEVSAGGTGWDPACFVIRCCPAASCLCRIGGSTCHGLSVLPREQERVAAGIGPVWRVHGLEEGGRGDDEDRAPWWLLMCPMETKLE